MNSFSLDAHNDEAKFENNQLKDTLPATGSPSNQLLGALLEMSRQVMSSLDLQEVLDRLTKHAQMVIGTDMVLIALVEKDGLTRVSHQGLGANYDFSLSAASYLAGKGLGGMAYNSGQIIACEDYWTDPRIDHDPLIDAQTREAETVAVLVVPIKLGGETVGLMWANKAQPYSWTPTDLVQAGQYGEIAGLAICNARLYFQLEVLNRELQNRNRELEALQEFNRRLRGPIESYATAERALTLAMEAVSADTGILHLLNEQHPQELVLVVAVERDSEDRQKLAVLINPSTAIAIPKWLRNIKIGEGLVGKALETGESILIKDILEKRAEDPQVTLDPDPHWRSGLFVPLMVAERKLGVIALSKWEPGSFSEAQLGFVEMIAGQIATALEQVAKIEAQKEREQLSAVLALARTAAHDLNQPLSVLQGELDLVAIAGISPDEEVLARMQNAVEQMTTRIRAYQKIVRFQMTEALPGITVLNYHNAGPKSPL